MARATRDLRYFGARLGSARRIEPVVGPDRVVFGCTTAVEREDGRSQTFQIVGEDEADPAEGSISYVSPLARALTGKKVGDGVQIAGGIVEIIAIR
jgi:transcription elongation GreA/GreB family factor